MKIITQDTIKKNRKLLEIFTIADGSDVITITRVGCENYVGGVRKLASGRCVNEPNARKIHANICA